MSPELEESTLGRHDDVIVIDLFVRSREYLFEVDHRDLLKVERREVVLALEHLFVDLEELFDIRLFIGRVSFVRLFFKVALRFGGSRVIRDEEFAVGHEVVLSKLCLEVVFRDVVRVERYRDPFFDELLDLLESHLYVLEGLDSRLAAKVQVKLRAGLSDHRAIDVCQDILFLDDPKLRAGTGRALWGGIS